jgi:hypothetical protein
VQCRSQRLWHASKVTASSQDPAGSKVTAGTTAVRAATSSIFQAVKTRTVTALTTAPGVSCLIGVVKASGPAETIKAEG